MTQFDNVIETHLGVDPLRHFFQDWINVDDVLDRCLGNMDLAEKVVGRFRAGLSGTCRNLESLARSGDLEGVARGAHRLKGEAANVGCQRISVLAADIEELATQRLHDGVMLAVDLLVEMCVEFQGELSDSRKDDSR